MEKSDQESYIIGLTWHTEEIKKRKSRFALRYQDIGDSGIEINDDGEAQSEVIKLGERVGDSQLGGGKIDPSGNQIPKKANQL